jgi:amino acid adenylation domain-containing protein
MLVQDFLHHSAERRPDKVALVCAGQRLTYTQIDAHANRLANALRAHGVTRGDRVVVFLNNSVECVVSIFAILKAGGVFVVVNKSTKPEKLAYILNNCRAVALITGRSATTGRFGSALADLEWLKTVVVCGAVDEDVNFGRKLCLGYDQIQQEGSGVRPQPVNIDLDLACLIYTSGTTGEAKGVMSDHSNVVFAVGSIIKYLRNTEADIVIDVLPLSFDYGLYQLLMTFKFGGTLVLEDSFTYPVEILKRIAEEKVTGFPGVPTVFALLVRMDLSGFNLQGLRYLTNTAAALPPSHIQELREKFPGVTLYSMYGLTETKRTLYLPPEWLDRKPGSVGIAIPGTEVWIEDESGLRLGAGSIGELVVRGRHVMRGYWETPEATAQRFRPGRLPGERCCHTGDLFRMDEDGCMYFVGRKDDIIKSRGEKVAPKEVENVLHALKGVVEAAVVGVPDPVLGQAIKAFLVIDDPSLTPGAVMAHCRAHLEDFMLPKQIEFRDSLPKSPSGKIRKQDLV